MKWIETRKVVLGAHHLVQRNKLYRLGYYDTVDRAVRGWLKSTKAELFGARAALEHV